MIKRKTTIASEEPEETSALSHSKDDDIDWLSDDWGDDGGTDWHGYDPDEIISSTVRTEKGFSQGVTIEVKEENYADGRTKITRTTTYGDGKKHSHSFFTGSGGFSHLGWGTSGASYTDFYGRKKVGQSYSSSWSSRYGNDWWNSSFAGKENKNEQYNKIISSIRRSANIVSNAKEGEKEKAIDVRWSDGSKTNQVNGNFVYISPDVVTEGSTRKAAWNKDELSDVLIGEVLSQSAMKRTMSAAVERRMIKRGDDGPPDGKLSKSLWYTTEMLAAEQDVTNDYPGFNGYFASHRSYYTDEQAKEWIQARLNQRESAENAMLALRWQLLHPEENLELPKHTAMALDLSFKEIAKTKTSNEREKVAIQIAQNFLKVWPVNPPPPTGGKKGNKGQKGPKGQDEWDMLAQSIGESEERQKNEEAAEAKAKAKDKPKSKGRGSEKEPDLGPEDFKIGESENRGKEAVSNKGGVEEDENNRLEQDPTCYEGDNWKGGTKEVYLQSNSSTDKLYQELVNKLRGPIVALRNRLKFQNEDTRITEHGLKTGNLDEGSLFKLGFIHHGYDDPYLFEEQSIIDTPEVAVCILVDESGSMTDGVERYGDGKVKYVMARETAITLVNALKPIRGLDICVFGHTAHGHCQGEQPYTRDYASGLALHHYYTPKVKSEGALVRISGTSWNLDGYAISKAGQHLLEWYGGHKKKLMIVISDGYPNAPSYGGWNGRAHVNKVCKKLNHFGVDVVAIGLGSQSKSTFEEMYGQGNVVILDSDISTGLMATTGNFITKTVQKAGAR